MDVIKAYNQRVYWEKGDSQIEFHEDKIVIRTPEFKEPVSIKYSEVISASVLITSSSSGRGRLIPARRFAELIIASTVSNSSFRFSLDTENRMIDFAVIKKYLKLDEYSVSERELVWMVSYTEIIIYVLVGIAITAVLLISGWFEN